MKVQSFLTLSRSCSYFLIRLRFARWLRSIRPVPVRTPVATAEALCALPILVPPLRQSETAGMCPVPDLALKRAELPYELRVALAKQRPFALSARACCRQSVPSLRFHR